MAEVIVALDAPARADALKIVERLGDAAGFYKVGLELYTRVGPAIVEELVGRDKRVFLDLKLHDIPNTIAATVAAAADLGVELLTIHAAGGAAMLEAGASAASDRLRLVAVTVLTSLTGPDLGAAWGRDVEAVSEEVVRLSVLAREAGVAGVVASAGEAARVKARMGRDFLVVTPGIRPTGADRHDQMRVATPAEAVRAGSDYLIVGRPVTAAEHPEEALDAIQGEIAGAGSALA